MVGAGVADDGTSSGGTGEPVVKLSCRSKDLYVLWAKWEHGVGGVRPAKSFSRCERGANRFAFSQRLVFWRVVHSLVLHGHTSDAAIDKVYAVYGRSLEVLKVLNCMRADQREGGHPELK